MPEHSSITDPNIHEPKGIATASSGQVYIANGAGSGSWRYIPHGFIYYDNIGTGFTITAPTSYTIINPTTTADVTPIEFTHNSAGRMTYSGTTTIDVNLACSITMKHSTGTGQDCFFQIHKNGSPLAGAQAVRTADSANYGSIVIVGHTEIATNDYFELYCKVAAGNIIVHAFAFDLIGKI